MRIPGLLLLLFFAVALPAAADTIYWTDKEVDELYRAAHARRNGVWTKDISSMDDLRNAYCQFVKWLDRAALLEQPCDVDFLWAQNLAKAKGRILDLGVATPLVTAMIWRQRLVEFAGEHEIAKLEKALPRQYPDYHGRSDGEDVLVRVETCSPGRERDLPRKRLEGYTAPPEMVPYDNTGDFGSTRMRFVPGQGLRNSRL